MPKALAAGNRIEMRGCGSFALNTRPPRVGRNPKSGEKVLVPEKCVPHFKAGKELRELVDLSPDPKAGSAISRARAAEQKNRLSGQSADEAPSLRNPDERT